MSDSPRPDVVERLAQGALQGMLGAVGHFTNNEVMSAYFTMLKRGIRTAIAMSPSQATRTALSNTLMELLAECADPDLKN